MKKHQEMVKKYILCGLMTLEIEEPSTLVYHFDQEKWGLKQEDWHRIDMEVLFPSIEYYDHREILVALEAKYNDKKGKKINP